MRKIILTVIAVTFTLVGMKSWAAKASPLKSEIKIAQDGDKQSGNLWGG